MHVSANARAMQSNSAMIMLAAQNLTPAALLQPATANAFTHKTSSSARFATLNSYYPLDVQLSVSSTSTCTFDLQYGDYISAVSLVCVLPSVINVTTAKVNAAGGRTGGTQNFRGVVPSTSVTQTNIAMMNYVMREDTATEIGAIASEADAVSSLVNERNTTNNFAAHFCDYTGAQLIKSVELLVNGLVRQCFGGAWLFLFNELYRTQAGKAAAAIGSAEAISQLGAPLQSDTNRVKKLQALSGSEMEIDLPFFFTQATCGSGGGTGGPFPLCQFARQDAVKIRFTFNSLRSLVVNSAGLGGEAITLAADCNSSPCVQLQTVTVANNTPGQSSSVASYLMRLSSPPTAQDFRVSDFTFGIRITEVYVSPETLAAQRFSPYFTATAHPVVCERSVSNASEITFDEISAVKLPAYAVYAYGSLGENRATNQNFATAGAVDALTGKPQRLLTSVSVKYGSNTLNKDASTTLTNLRNAANFSNSVSSKNISQISLSPTNLFPVSPTGNSLSGANSAAPSGGVVLSAVNGTVVAKVNQTAFANATAVGGNNYSAGRSQAAGNSVLVTCVVLFFSTLSIQPDNTGSADPTVRGGIAETPDTPTVPTTASVGTKANTANTQVRPNAIYSPYR